MKNFFYIFIFALSACGGTTPEPEISCRPTKTATRMGTLALTYNNNQQLEKQEGVLKPDVYSSYTRKIYYQYNDDGTLKYSNGQNNVLVPTPPFPQHFISVSKTYTYYNDSIKVQFSAPTGIDIYTLLLNPQKKIVKIKISNLSGVYHIEKRFILDNNDNITQIYTTQQGVNNGNEYLSHEITYDNKKNPKYYEKTLFLEEIVDYLGRYGLGKNNPTNIKTYFDNGDVLTTQCANEYDSNDYLIKSTQYTNNIYNDFYGFEYNCD